MDHLDKGTPSRDLRKDIDELRAAVGLEEYESTSGNGRSTDTAA